MPEIWEVANSVATIDCIPEVPTYPRNYHHVRYTSCVLSISSGIPAEFTLLLHPVLICMFEQNCCIVRTPCARARQREVHARARDRSKRNFCSCDEIVAAEVLEGTGKDIAIPSIEMCQSDVMMNT